MSYCVHCGVELAKSQNKCPLCGTPVLDPKSPWIAPSSMPYPEQIESIKSRINHTFAMKISLLLLISISAIVLAIDGLSSDEPFWSFFVIGALACFEAIFIMPFFTRGFRPYFHISIDHLSIAIYVFIIFWLTKGSNWYFRLALPLIANSFVYCLALVYTLRRIKLKGFTKGTIFLLLTSVNLILMELIIDLFMERVFISWSIFSSIPLITIAAFLLILSQKNGLKEKLNKKMFF